MTDQEAAESLTNVLLNGDDHTRVILSGPAGTGKSTYIRNLVTQALSMKPKKQVRIICPTHKSICNLTEGHPELQGLISTYASFFRCVYDILDDSGLKCLIPCCDRSEHSSDINDVITCLRSEDKEVEKNLDLLIVEEASMFNHQYFLLLEHYVGIKAILFVGDSNQIPPITSNCSDCLKCSFSVFRTNIHTVSFKEQKRHCNQLHVSLQTFMKNVSGGVLSNLKLKTLLKKIFEHKTLSAALPLDAPILTYHVNTAQQINHALTKSRQTIQKGDVVMIDSGSIEEIPVGSIVSIKSVSKEFFTCIRLERGFNFVVYEVEYQGSDYTINVIDPDEKDMYKNYCREFRQEKPIGEKYKINKLIREHLTQFNFAYALTAHKAQGLTYDTSYLAYEDILSCKDKIMVIQLLYSAITRAREKVYLIQVPDHYKAPDCSIISDRFRCS